MTDHPIDDEEFDLGPSKTQLKKAAHAMQDLGEILSQMNDQKLAQLPLSEEVLSAVHIARGMKANSARKRQIQYIGKLIRHDNGEQIAEALAALEAESSNSHQWMQLAEHWSTRLTTETDALEAFLNQYNQADRQQLRALLRNCKKLPPDAIQSPAFKKLRKWLRECMMHHTIED